MNPCVHPRPRAASWFLAPLVLASLALAGPALAGSTAPTAGRGETAAEARQQAPAPLNPQADLFDDLAAAEDPALANHSVRGDLTAGEVILVILFMIIFFPVGIILLIVFLADDDDDDVEIHHHHHSRLTTR